MQQRVVKKYLCPAAHTVARAGRKVSPGMVKSNRQRDALFRCTGDQEKKENEKKEGQKRRMQRGQEHDNLQGADPFVAEISVKGRGWNGKMLSTTGDV